MVLAPAFEGVRLKLLSSGLLASSNASRSIALTAMGRHDGVTTVAVGTAAAIASHDGGGVLLVDGTPLGTRCAALLGMDVPALHSGAETGALERHVTPVPGLGFDLLALAAAPPQAGEEVASGAWRALWESLRQGYRHVLVDAGSLDTDAPHRWAGWVDHTALVLDTTRVTREMLESFRREMRHGGPTFAGFIFNKRKFHVPARLYRALS
jgi:Mrp family chromosome partitioning ATPase